MPRRSSTAKAPAERPETHARARLQRRPAAACSRELDEYVAAAIARHDRRRPGRAGLPRLRRTSTIEFRSRRCHQPGRCSTRSTSHDLRPHHRARLRARRSTRSAPTPRRSSRCCTCATSRTRTGVDLNIVSEMLDDRNRELAEVTQADDFIVSDKLISLMLSQVSARTSSSPRSSTSCSRADGAEIYLRPAEQYVTPGHERRLLHGDRGGPPPRRDRDRLPDRGERAQRATSVYGVRVNPLKTERTFTAGDKIIVLAEG